MALIFKDTLQATDSTGLYTLMADIDGTWTDIHTIAGEQNGNIQVGVGSNTIAVDTTMFPVGRTFQFKWMDSLGNESNIVSALVPFTILDYYTTSEDITYVNNGGDSWTFTVPYTPPPNDQMDILYSQILFYSDSGVSTLINETVTSTQSYSYSGLGAGTYMMQTVYRNAAGAHIVIAAALLMVDAAGNVLRQLVTSGFTDVSFSGMNISCTANYQITNATIQYGAYLTYDSNFSNEEGLSLSNPLVNQQLPLYTRDSLILVYGLELDPTEWTPGVQDIGCIMTVITNIP